MAETDLQLGGGYTYQWECAILLALNYFFEPVRYNPTLFDLIQDFLGEVTEIHLEGEDRETGVDLEDINLVSADGDRRILIQVKTKQAEGKLWTPGDPLLLKSLYRFYDSGFFAERPDEVRFVFLSNRGFNRALVKVKDAIREGAPDQCPEADQLHQSLARYASREKKGSAVDVARFRKLLARTALVEYLAVDTVKANIQAKLQGYGRKDWEQAHKALFEYFARQSTRSGGGVVTRDVVVEVLGPPPSPQPTTLYEPPTLPGIDTVPEPGPLPPGSRPGFHRNALFTGRVGPLKDLAQALLYSRDGGAHSTLVTQAVQGMGGIGKTQLAVEFAHRYGRFFHGVHWINAAEPAGIAAEVAACGGAMGLPNWPREQPEQVACTLIEWQRGGSFDPSQGRPFDSAQDRPRLVILDNLENVGAAREWLGRLSGGGVRVLLTARRTDWPVDMGLEPLRLNVFTKKESREFLRRYLSEERASAGDLKVLAERVHHLPLALELAGRYLQRIQRLTVVDYLEKLEDIWDHPSMKGWREELESPTGHDLDMLATFGLSWERVEDEGARRIFLVAGYCAPNQPIPCELLERAAGLETEGCDEALDVLVGLGLLVMEDPQSGPTIHPLLAEYARHQEMAPTHLSALADALARLARAANDQMDQTGSPSHFLPLLPHVRPVAEAAEAPEATEAAEGESAEDAANLWGNLGYYLRRVADYAGAREAYERALRIFERVLGADHPNVATLVNNLGLVLQALGDLAGAREALERALRIDEAVYGPDHPEVATDVNNLGGVVQDLGDLAGAREAYERALRIDEAVYGPDHPNVARDVNNLGSVLQDLGDLAGAREAYERALNIFERMLPPDHPYIKTVRANLEVLG